MKLPTSIVCLWNIDFGCFKTHQISAPRSTPWTLLDVDPEVGTGHGWKMGFSYGFCWRNEGLIRFHFDAIMMDMMLWGYCICWGNLTKISSTKICLANPSTHLYTHSAFCFNSRQNPTLETKTWCQIRWCKLAGIRGWIAFLYQPLSMIHVQYCLFHEIFIYRYTCIHIYDISICAFTYANKSYGLIATFQ